MATATENGLSNCITERGKLERFARIDLDIRIDMAWKSIATRTHAVGEEVKKKIVNPSPVRTWRWA